MCAMAARLTGIGWVTKFVLVPAALAALGFYVIGPRIGVARGGTKLQPADNSTRGFVTEPAACGSTPKPLDHAPEGVQVTTRPTQGDAPNLGQDFRTQVLQRLRILRRLRSQESGVTRNRLRAWPRRQRIPHRTTAAAQAMPAATQPDAGTTGSTTRWLSLSSKVIPQAANWLVSGFSSKGCSRPLPFARLAILALVMAGCRGGQARPDAARSRQISTCPRDEPVSIPVSNR